MSWGGSFDLLIEINQVHHYRLLPKHKRKIVSDIMFADHIFLKKVFDNLVKQQTFIHLSLFLGKRRGWPASRWIDSGTVSMKGQLLENWKVRDRSLWRKSNWSLTGNNDVMIYNNNQRHIYINILVIHLVNRNRNI